MDDSGFGFVALANELLSRFQLPNITNLAECTPQMFIRLYEGILGEKHPYLVSVRTKQDEVTNIQAVINSLAQDVLHADLSHISGQAVVDGDEVSIRYLLEIFTGLMEYVMEQITSGPSTDLEDDMSGHDPDILTQGTISTISDILQEELGTREPSYTTTSNKTPSSQRMKINDVSLPSTISNVESQYDSEYSSDSTVELPHHALARNSVTLLPQDALLIADTKVQMEAEKQQQRHSVNFDRYKTTYGNEAQPQVRDDDSEGEKIKRMVAQNKSHDSDRETEKQRVESRKDGIDISSASGPYVRSSDMDSTANRGSVTIERQLQHKRHLQDEEVSSSLASVSPTALPLPSASENAFASLGIRPKPASHPDFHTNNQDRRLNVDSTMVQGKGQRVQRHVHTHHHFHKSDISPYPSTSTRMPSRLKQASHTVSRPPPDADSDPEPGRSKFSSSLQDRPRHTPSSNLNSRLARSLPLTTHHPVVKVSPLGYNLSSLKQKEKIDCRKATRTLPRRKVAFAVDNVLDLPEDEREADLDKDTVLRLLRDRLIATRTQDRLAANVSDDSDVSMHSDSVVDYSPIPQAKRHRVNSPQREKRSRCSVVKPVLKKNQVHFDEALEAEAKGEFGKIRRSIRKEGKGHKRKTKVMKEVYENHLNYLQAGQEDLMTKKQTAAAILDKKYQQVHQIPQLRRYSAAKKYTPTSLTDNRERGRGRASQGKRKRSASSSPTLSRCRKPFVIEDDEMLPAVISEFPMLHVSPHTSHNMWSKQMRQIEQLTKAGFNQSRKSKTQIKMEDSQKRQELLLSIMKKELAHNQRMKDIKEKQEYEKAMRCKAKEQRQATARARRYYDQFGVRARARMMKRKNREEQIFKKLFEDGLEIQKSRIRELRKYAKEKREEMANQQQNEIQSLENYYTNQFAMLAEAIGQERHDLLVRDNAQAKVMSQMKRELRRKMETEIKEFQSNLYRDEDTEYFRQIEADRMRSELQMATYKTSV